MRRRAACAALLAALALGACGQSKADRAKSTVCSARTDIKKQVDSLKGLTLSTATTSQISTSLKAIGEDLGKIAGAQGDLSAQRRQEVQKANQAFTSQIKDIASSLGSATSLSEASSAVTSALQKLATSYEQTLAKVDCSG